MNETILKFVNLFDINIIYYFKYLNIDFKKEVFSYNKIIQIFLFNKVKKKGAEGLNFKICKF